MMKNLTRPSYKCKIYILNIFGHIGGVYENDGLSVERMDFGNKKY
jgi:hypothetical protein